MKIVYVITHPEVIIDPKVPVPRWPLSEKGCARIERLVGMTWLQSVSAVYSSDEQKAVDGAKILADSLSLPVQEINGIEEVDRSSTGYLPQKEHDFNAQMLFKHPAESVDGWETAKSAQKRMVAAVNDIIIQHNKHHKNGTGQNDDLVIVTHGAVGSFLMSHLKHSPIESKDTPGLANGGGIFAFDAESLTILSDWRDIDHLEDVWL